MARVISTISKVNIGMKIINYLKDGSTESNIIFVEDIVNGLSYVDHNVTKKASGRVSDIKYTFDSVTKNPSTNNPKSFLTTDATIDSVVVDQSTAKHSNVVEINSREILEYNTTKEAKRVAVIPVMTVDLTIGLSDKTSEKMLLEEGKELYGVTLLKHGTEETNDYKIASFIYNYNESRTNVYVQGMILTGNGKVECVRFDEIKSCGKVGMVVDQEMSFVDAFNAASADATIAEMKLPAKSYTEQITLNSNMIIDSKKADVPANTGARCNPEIAEDETVLTEKLIVEEGAAVSLRGLTITENSRVQIQNAEAVVLKNCKFTGAVAYDKKSFLVLDKSTGTGSVKLTIDGCYFGPNVVQGSNKYYNLIELHRTIADGSCVKNSYFAKGCCSNNIICLYAIDDGATFDIENCMFEYAANGLRVGIKGAPKCTINIKDVTYLESDNAYPDYAGFIIFQPYGNDTTTFKGIRVNIDNLVGPKGIQDYYFYCEGSTMQFNDETKPVIYKDGALQK